MSDSWRPRGLYSLPRSSVHGIFQARGLEWVAITAAGKSLQSCPTLCDPIDGSPPGSPPSLGFSGQEPWSGLSFPSPVSESEKWKWSRSVVSNSLQLMDCSLPRSSIHGIFQARILEWVAISFSRRSSQPRDWTLVSRIVGRLFTVWATREVAQVTKSKPNSRGWIKEMKPTREFLSKMPSTRKSGLKNNYCYSWPFRSFSLKSGNFLWIYITTFVLQNSFGRARCPNIAPFPQLTLWRHQQTPAPVPVTSLWKSHHSQEHTASKCIFLFFPQKHNSHVWECRVCWYCLTQWFSIGTSIKHSGNLWRQFGALF